MTHSELYNRFQNIQSRKNNLRTEMLNYIICTLKNCDNHIGGVNGPVRLDKLNEDFPFVVSIAGKNMHLMEISRAKDDEVMVMVCDGQTSKIHNLYLETESMENLEMAAAFINHSLVEIGEKNLYSVLVVYNNDNSRKLFPNSFNGLNDAEAWSILRGLNSHEVKVFQINGPKQKFESFDAFIEQMNEDGFSGCHAIRLHLKEKYL